MKKVTVLLCFLLPLFLIGCDIYKIQLIDEYYISTPDDIYQMAVTYKESQDSYVIIIDAAVFAAGANENFIIAKQHPCKFGDTPNKKITNYFIIPLKNKLSEDPVENKIGPLSKIEFEHERKKLGIDKDLDFTIIIKELE